MHVRQIAMSYDAGVRIGSFQTVQQPGQCLPLAGRARIGHAPFRVKSTLVAHPDAMGVVSSGVGPGQLFISRLEHATVALHIVVVGGIPEAVQVAAYQGVHRERLVLAGSRAMHDDEFYSSHSPVFFRP